MEGTLTSGMVHMYILLYSQERERYERSSHIKVLGAEFI